MKSYAVSFRPSLLETVEAFYIVSGVSGYSPLVFKLLRSLHPKIVKLLKNNTVEYSFCDRLRTDGS